MSKFNLGRDIEAKKDLSVDIGLLLRTRMLIQANSGGGKSFVLRRILEQSHGKVQQIVLDLEGEFSTLREKYDYVLVGKGGDIAANVRSAGLLAERLLELGVSAICDLYELKHRDRILFVKTFLDAMINVRKELWRPCLVVVDEAHVFAPEKGESEALGSVIDLCTRGRKRSFCVVLATQRLSKLHKDAAAECNNKLIGRTGLDVDMKRAGEELGFTNKQDILSLRALEPGEFYAFGPAISQTIIKTKVGPVLTTHPDVGTKATVVVPPAPEKVKRMLSQLADLPKEAEEKIQTVEAFKKKVRELEAQVRSTKPRVDESAVSRAIEQAKAQSAREWTKRERDLEAVISKQQGMMRRAAEMLVGAAVSVPAYVPPPATPRPYVPVVARRVPVPVGDGEERTINAGARRLLAALVQWYPNGMSEGQWRSHAGLRKTGTYTTYRSTLKSAGLIEQRGGEMYATQSGVEYLGDERIDTPTNTEEMLALWIPKLGPSPAKMLQALIAHGGEPITNEQLAEECGWRITGTYTTYRSKLVSAKLAVLGRGTVAANKETLFL